MQDMAGKTGTILETEMGIRFFDMPKSRKFEIERKAMFKPEDGIRNMAFSETMEIEIRVSAVRSEEARKDLEVLADTAMEKAKKIIAKYETLQ